MLHCKVTSSEVTESGVTLTMEPSKGGASTTMEADVVLVATGRRPYTANLGCDDLGISLDKMGRIEVDDHFRTAVPSVYAIGDCIAGPMLAHKAEEEGIACVETIAGFAGHVNYDAIPGVVYTYPEVAEVGYMGCNHFIVISDPKVSLSQDAYRAAVVIYCTLSFMCYSG